MEHLYNIYHTTPQQLVYFLVAAGNVIVVMALFCIVFAVFCKKTRQYMHNIDHAQTKSININTKLLEVKLKLAKQYIELKDTESAVSLLNAIIATGNAEFAAKAKFQLENINQ